MSALSDRDRAILEFEKTWWRFEGAKHEAIRGAVPPVPTRYYQVLNGLLDDPAALAEEPVVVRRLQGQRQARRRAISSRSA